MSEETPDKPVKRLAPTSASAERAEQEGTPVRRVPTRRNIKTGKPKRLPKVAQMHMRAFGGGGGGGGGGGSGGIGGGIGGGFGNSGILDGIGTNPYSPELSTDFLELPQSIHEQWNYYRFFYRTEPFVGQAVDLHTELPLSRIRIGMPKARNRKLALAATRYCEKWAKKVGLLLKLIGIVHEYNLIGEVYIWSEDDNPDPPEDLEYEIVRVLKGDELIEEKRRREDADKNIAAWMKKHYKGWTDLTVLPPEQVHKEEFNFTSRKLFELIPDSKSKDIVGKADAGDKHAQYIVEDMMPDVVAAIREGKNVQLNTDPYAGGFMYNLSRKRSPYARWGQSVLERCIRTLVFRDKLRQANTSIASRHMTPIRLVFAEDMDAQDVEDLREQVDMALLDPDFSIIANFEIRWEEMGSDQRLLDLTSEYDLTDRQLYAGLGVTESLLSGESSYSGDRINLQVINTRYMLMREILQQFVEEQLFRPMCARMGFVEEDEDGDMVVIYPSLSFTRLALIDNQEMFDALFNLYQKGSLPIDIILELLNIDPVMAREKLEADKFTMNDATFNEVFRSIYSEAGRALAENSNATEVIAENLGLDYTKPPEGGGRF